MNISDSLIIILLVLGSGTVSGQSVENAESDKELSKLEYINAEAIEHPQPKYPYSALRNNEEGWVILSYVVTKEGDIDEAMVEDSSGSKNFEHAAIKMIKKWKYKPAKLNGEPVDQSMTEIKITFMIDESVKSARPRFVFLYRKIKKLIDEKKFETAKQELTDLQLKEKNNLYEDAWFWLLNYMYLDAVGSNDNKEKITSLRRAVGYEINYLPTDLFAYAIQELYKLQVEEFDINAAINTFKKLDNLKSGKHSDHYKQVHDVLEKHVKKLFEIINGKEILSLNGRIAENDYWVHNLIRRSFSIGKVDGELKDIEIRCSSSHLKKLRSTSIARKYTISEHSAWNIPESWKDCGLYVKGEQGATFTLYEYPNTSSKIINAGSAGKME